MNDGIADHEAWPARAAVLAAIGAAFGITVNLILDDGRFDWSEDPLRMAAAALLAVGGVSFAFTLERTRWLWSALFGLACGLVSALVFFWNGSPGGWTSGDEWRVIAMLLAIAVAAPLFQSARDAGAHRFVPAEVHGHAWTNLVLWFAAWAFVGISLLLAFLLSELFSLIGITVLRNAMREGWFVMALVGGALGGAIGLLRDRDNILGLLQRVVTTVLSVLAPVLAAGLVLFVLALPFVGLKPLWKTTSATTPILLLAVAGAFILANAVVGNSAEDEAKARPLRWSALALACVMAPLAVVAAISTWLRIEQHGFTPERLWALVFVVIVLAVALTYLWTGARGRGAWMASIRPVNVRLATAICAIALLLATPLIDFGAIATRDQLARLQSGRIQPDRFDWAALRFDFGPDGRRALERLAREGRAPVRTLAAEALAAKQRWDLQQDLVTRDRTESLARSLRVLPRPVPVPPQLREALARGTSCSAGGDCTLLWNGAGPQAVAIGFACPTCPPQVTALVRDPQGRWVAADDPAIEASGDTSRQMEAQRQAVAAGRVEVRSVERRQVFIDGSPVGQPFQ